MEIKIGRSDMWCSGFGACPWIGNPQTIQQPIAPSNYNMERTPTLASLGLSNLPANSLIAVGVRLKNPDGWSAQHTQSIRVAPAVDPRDTLPTNIAPPQLGSYGAAFSGDLVVGNRIGSVSGGRWAPGAVSRPQSIRMQFVRCPDAACQVTPAQYEASGMSCRSDGPLNDLATQDLNCYLSDTITSADTCFRMRSSAQNRKGWSAWAESVVKCVPGVNGGGDGSGSPAGSLNIDLGAVVPLRPGVVAVDLVQPAPTRLATFNAEANPIPAIAAGGSLTAGTAYGAVGSTWRLPNGWQAPNLLANTTFTLFGCTGQDKSTCTAAGTWPASSLFARNPSLASTGPIALAVGYARIAQTSVLLDRAGARVPKTVLSDWVRVVAAAQPVADAVAAENAADGAGSAAAAGAGDAEAPGVVDIPSALVAAGVDGRITPLVGTDGEGIYQGTSLKVTVPPVQTRGVKAKATATVTPRTKGKVLFTFTRTGPNGKVAVGKTRTVKVRGTKAKASWTFANSKPTGTYLLIVRFVPSKKGATGAMVTKSILVR
jgi:hypothetical protein